VRGYDRGVASNVVEVVITRGAGYRFTGLS
jgi:hypothetical protein